MTANLNSRCINNFSNVNTGNGIKFVDAGVEGDAGSA